MESRNSTTDGLEGIRLPNQPNPLKGHGSGHRKGHAHGRKKK